MNTLSFGVIVTSRNCDVISSMKSIDVDMLPDASMTRPIVTGSSGDSRIVAVTGFPSSRITNSPGAMPRIPFPARSTTVATKAMACTSTSAARSPAFTTCVSSAVVPSSSVATARK